ncbi:MAG: Ig-like domain-containing protein, partial [Gammaproteobacteria bacterium]|nr:Ig-like domain-containing protein [Gammaproteobacteria bacterium]
MRPNLLLCLTFSLYACGGGGSNTSDPQQEDHSGPEIVSDTINPSSAGTAPVAIKDFAHVQITVVFNEPIDRSTLVSAIGLTSNAAATPLLNAEDIVYTATPPTVVVSPKNLSEGASYTFKITTALKDVAGNRLVKEKTKSFTTANSAKIFAHVTGLADGTQFMLNPNLSGGLGGAVAVGNGDTLVATKLDVGDTYKISLTNVPAGRFCSPELSDGAVTGTTTINISCGDVLPRYAVAPQWNDYAQTANPDTACAADTASPQTQLGYTSCLHGGEQRTMKVPNAQACTDIDIKATTDNFPQPNGVGAFEWRCETLNNEVYVTSTHLKDQARLVDLIDLADPNRPKWREARVTVTYANKVQYQSLPSRWWANPIKNASTLSPSALDGTIWVADHAQASSITSVSLKGKKAAFVVERGVALNNLTKGTQHDAMQIGVNGSDNAHFHWLEGNFIVTRSPGQNTDANTVHYAGIRMYGQYNVIRHTTIYDQGNSNGLNADNVRNNLIEHVSIFGSGFAGISLIGDYNTLSDVALGGHGFQGINANVKDTAGMYVLGAHNTFTHIRSLGNAGYGILLECNSTRPNTYNRIAFGTVSNNLGAGLVVKCN